MSNLRPCVVIPEYNRPAFLRRVLDFYKDRTPELEFLIADSSYPAAAKQARQAVEKVRGDLDITYVHYDPDVNFVWKSVDALTHTTARYIIWMNDDDLIVPEAAWACAEFLEDHAGYATALGHILTLKSQGGPLSGDAPEDHWLTGLMHRSIESGDPLDRVREYFRQDAGTPASVYRRDDFEAIFGAAAELRSTKVQELAWDVLAAARGKKKVLDQVYQVRQPLPATLKQREDFDLWQGWPQTIFSEFFTEEYQRYREAATHEILARCDLAPHAVRQALDQALWEHLIEEHAPAEATTTRTGRGIRRISQAASAAPRAIQQGVGEGNLGPLIRSLRRHPLGTYHHVRKGFPLGLTIDALLDPGSRYHGAFLPVYEQLTAYPFGLDPSGNPLEEPSDPGRWKSAPAARPAGG